MEKEKEIENEIILFFVVNPKSGAQEGKHLIELNKEEICFDNVKVNDKLLHAYIYDITNPSSYKKGKETLQNLANKKKDTRFIIGGGDGSVLSIIEGLILEDIDLTYCTFGVLPLGTGNDLSNAMGFGGTVSIESTIDSFKEICINYANAIKTTIDIWQVKLILDEKEGLIFQNT